LNRQADPAAPHFAVFDELIGHVTRQVAWDRTAQADANVVDANDLSLQIDERPSRIARENPCMVPYPLNERTHFLTVQPERSHGPREHHFAIADDSECDRLRKCQRATHGEHPVTDLHGIRIAKFRDWEWTA